MGGFKKFLLRGNLVDLAVAVVIGLAFAALVTALVADLITPLIAAVVGKPDFGKLAFTVNHSQFKYGDFLNQLITFIVIAAVVYFLTKNSGNSTPQKPLLGADMNFLSDGSRASQFSHVLKTVAQQSQNFFRVFATLRWSSPNAARASGKMYRLGDHP